MNAQATVHLRTDRCAVCELETHRYSIVSRKGNWHRYISYPCPRYSTQALSGASTCMVCLRAPTVQLRLSATNSPSSGYHPRSALTILYPRTPHALRASLVLGPCDRRRLELYHNSRSGTKSGARGRSSGPRHRTDPHRRPTVLVGALNAHGLVWGTARASRRSCLFPSGEKSRTS
jgi:hypothetical protein